MRALCNGRNELHSPPRIYHGLKRLVSEMLMIVLKYLRRPDRFFLTAESRGFGPPARFPSRRGTNDESTCRRRRRHDVAPLFSDGTQHVLIDRPTKRHIYRGSDLRHPGHEDKPLWSRAERPIPDSIIINPVALSMSVEPSVSDAVAVEMEASQDGGEGSPAGGAPAAEGKVKIPRWVPSEEARRRMEAVFQQYK